MIFIFFHWSLYRFLSFLFQQNPPQRHIQHPPPSFHQWLPTNNWINFLQIVQQLLPTFPSPSINCVQHLPPSFSPNHSFIPHNFPFPQWSSSDLPSNYYYYYYYYPISISNCASCSPPSDHIHPSSIPISFPIPIASNSAPSFPSSFPRIGRRLFSSA